MPHRITDTKIAPLLAFSQEKLSQVAQNMEQIANGRTNAAVVSGRTFGDERQWFIYVLKDPRTGDIRYVGHAFDLKKRLAQHVSESLRFQRLRHSLTHKENWILELQALGLRPSIHAVECGFDLHERNHAEARWIAKYRSDGAVLTNSTDGGDGVIGYVVTDEARRRMSEAQGRIDISLKRLYQAKSAAVHRAKGRHLTEEQKARIVAARRARNSYVVSDAARQRMSLALKGKKKPAKRVEEQRQLLREYWSRVRSDPEAWRRRALNVSAGRIRQIQQKQEQIRQQKEQDGQERLPL